MLVSVDAVRSVEHMRPSGYMDAILGSGVRSIEPGVGEVVDIPDAVYWSLVRRYSPETVNARLALYACGPGCQLKRTLAWWGFRDDGSCGCDSFAAQMDADGPDGCEARIDSIVAHLVEQAAKRSVFLGAAPSYSVLLLVRQAINAARKETESLETGERGILPA